MKTFQMRLFHILILACLLAVPPASPAQALGTIYVKWNAAGSNNGTSWTNAYTSLQSALAAAASGDEIWVAAGSYKPTTGADRAVWFRLESGVAVYGGFAGTETSRDQRNSDPATNGTVLSGDIGTVGDNSDNSYHVVIGSFADHTAILNGFTVTGGNAIDGGGGLFNNEGSPTLVNVIFSANSASGPGGGMRNYNGSPTLTNVTFSDNTATNYGGGMYNDSSSPTLTNVTFSGNSASNNGGGMFNAESNLTLTNVTFSDNTATNYGGGMYNLGSSLALANVTFSGNSATAGGGTYNNNSSSPTLTNVTFSSNTAAWGGAMYNLSSSPKIRNTILWANTAPNGSQVYNSNSIPVIRYSAVQDGCPAGSTCSSIVTADPLLGTLGDYSGSTQTLPLQAGSSAIDTGNDTYCPASDQRGVTRPQGSHCDIGAYEYAPVHYVKWDAAGANNGSSWTNAYTDLQSALAVAWVGDEIWVAAGTYKPTTGTDRTATFQLVNDVAVYGGFAGTETDRDQRDPDTNVTFLSGDIGTEGDNSDNSYHVVTSSGTDNTVLLDGFTITGGNANAYPDNAGGGMYNEGSSPTLTNVTFSGNSASHSGGGMYNEVGSPTLANVTFSGNSADYGGGGMCNSSSSPTLTNITFSGNSADYGGGGMYNFYSSPTLTNVTFSNNSAAGYGGGMSNDSSSPKIRNTILWGNTAPTESQVYNTNSSTPVIRYSVVQEGCPTDSTCSNIITTDPLLGTLDNYGGSTETIPLQAGSSAINTGSDTYCPATDQRGVTRPKGLHCDIGAFEFTVAAPALLAPTDDEALLHKRPTFQWSEVPDITKYKIQASRYSTFEVLEINVNVMDSTYTPDTDLNANKEYFWRVKAQANGVWSAWSKTWRFTTGKPSSIPVLVSPADGVLLRDYTPLLDWNDSTVPAGREFDYYFIQIASDAKFSAIVLDEKTPGGVTGSSFEPSSDLPANAPYYWRVRAYNTDGHFSSWSMVWSFRTALQPPDIVSPLDEAVDVPRQPTLDWSDVTGATDYKLVVSRYPDFSTPLLSVNLTASIYHDTDWDFNLPRNQVIYWRVKALGDNPSAWTSGSFTTVP